MKKKYFLLSFAGVLPFLMATTPAPTNETATDGFIEFNNDSIAVTAVDPLLPTIEIQTDKKPTTGDYSIVYASDLVFGSHDLPTGDMTYYAENPTVTHRDGTTNEVPNFVEVYDQSGSKNGWKLTAKLDGPLKSSTGNQIAGVTMSLNNIHSDTTSGFDTTAISLGQQVTLAADTQESAVIAKDANGATAGLWIITFGNTLTQAAQSVSLFIPKTDNIQAGTYNTSLTWNFEAAL